MTLKKIIEKLQKWPRYSLSIIWTSFIVLACLIDPRPLTQDLPPIFGIDKVVHFVLYFVLIFLFLWEYNGRIWQGKLSQAKKMFWFTMLIACMLGLGLEYLQGLTAYRGMDEMDLVADIVGALFAYLFYFIKLTQHKQDEKN